MGDPLGHIFWRIFLKNFSIWSVYIIISLVFFPKIFLTWKGKNGTFKKVDFPGIDKKITKIFFQSGMFCISLLSVEKIWPKENDPYSQTLKFFAVGKSYLISPKVREVFKRFCVFLIKDVFFYNLVFLTN